MSEQSLSTEETRVQPESVEAAKDIVEGSIEDTRVHDPALAEHMASAGDRYETLLAENRDMEAVVGTRNMNNWEKWANEGEEEARAEYLKAHPEAAQLEDNKKS